MALVVEHLRAQPAGVQVLAENALRSFSVLGYLGARPFEILKLSIAQRRYLLNLVQPPTLQPKLPLPTIEEGQVLRLLL